MISFEEFCSHISYKKDPMSSLFSIDPLDSKYQQDIEGIEKYLSFGAEWMACAYVQYALLETRVEFGKADRKYLEEFESIINKIDPLEMAIIERDVTKHDQLAVIKEIGNKSSEELEALLHPGTTSYDILDTARSFLLKKSWYEIIRPTVAESINKLCEISERTEDYLQVGRTHLQDTTPVSFGAVIANYARRVAKRVESCDMYFNNLEGKISGMVGTGASIDMVIGEGMSEIFEEEVLEKLGLTPDYSATQIVQKEPLADVGHGVLTLLLVLNDISNDIRMMYSSAVGEVTSRDNKERLGGSSADATKNNPTKYENVCGTAQKCIGEILTLYLMISSDYQRDLRGSVMARYEPQLMLADTYRSFSNITKALGQLSINTDKFEENLQPIRDKPSEAMVAILRGEGWTHTKYGVGHDFVKKIGIKAQTENRKLLEVALEDDEFKKVYDALPDNKQRILNGELELYMGHSKPRAKRNRDFAREIANKYNIEPIADISS